MPRDALTPADLLGRIEFLNIMCAKCARRGRYRVRTLVWEIGLGGNLAAWLSGLSTDCPRNNAASFADRCDVRCPDLLKLAGREGGDAA
jgi:hypothetical protein